MPVKRQRDKSSENSLKKVSFSGKILKQGVVFEIFDYINHYTELKKIEKIVKNGENLICKTLEHFDICLHRDCYKVEKEREELCSVSLK
jgi:hypothetical protein